MALIQKLKEDHPELIKFLDEMPITLPDDKDPKIDSRTLQEYFSSLMGMEKLTPHK